MSGQVVRVAKVFMMARVVQVVPIVKVIRLFRVVQLVPIVKVIRLFRVVQVVPGVQGVRWSGGQVVNWSGGQAFGRSISPTGHCWATPTGPRPGRSSSFIEECGQVVRVVRLVSLDDMLSEIVWFSCPK